MLQVIIYNRVVIILSKIINLKANHNNYTSRQTPDCGCYHSVKDNKSESKSQPPAVLAFRCVCCYHSVKDNKSESKSQQPYKNNYRQQVVIILSKIINLKANHNY